MSSLILHFCDQQLERSVESIKILKHIYIFRHRHIYIFVCMHIYVYKQVYIIYI